MRRVIRVFPRLTSYTPNDDMAFIGDPPMMRPEADEVHVSCCFTWDIPKAERLAKAWGQYYPIVKLGGPAFNSPVEGFEPALYVKQGVVFTSRGCDNHCSFCLVPEREGRLQLLNPVAEGFIIQDNNFLACPPEHRQKVYQMLRQQKRAARFAGGLQASLVTDEIAEELRGLGIEVVFLAADTEGSLRPLEKALKRLSFLRRDQLRCYALLGYGGETIEQARTRLERIWELGTTPFAQLYRPSTGTVTYSDEWRVLARQWSRPAAMKAMHKRRDK